MINEDAPTMSAGNGGFSGSVAATGPVAGFDPILGGSGMVKKRKYKRKQVKEDAADRYGKSPAEIKIQLRKIYRPENHNKIKVKRLYPNEVIQWYWKKRQRALTDQ